MTIRTAQRPRLQCIALALFALLAATAARAEEPKREPAPTPPAATRPATAALEQKLFDAVNAERAKLKLPPFTQDDALAAVARAHSADMLQHHFFNHESPTTGNIGDRLFAAKIRVVGCSENIAKNVALAAAYDELMNSPGHRVNILHNTFTHCGIGIVKGPDTMLYITQVFTLPAPAYDLAALPQKLADQLNVRRKAFGNDPIPLNPALNKIAADQAALLARLGKEQPFDPTPKLKAAGITFTKIGSVQGKTWKPEDIVAPGEFAQLKSGELGLGFAEDTTHKDNGYGIIWAVAVFKTN